MKTFYLPIFSILLVSLFGIVSCSDPESQALRDLERDNYSFTPSEFVRAASAGDDEAVRNFLAAGMAPNTKDQDGNAALVSAASAGHLRIVQQLLRSGADVNIPGRDGWTALMMAAFNNNATMVETLIASKADANLRDNSGWTALMQAVYKGHLEIVKLLAPISDEGLDRALLVASLMGHESVTDELVSSGANIDARTEEGDTPLILAAQKGQTVAVRKLLSLGADPNLKNNIGETALQTATEHQHTAIIDMLNTAIATRAAQSQESEAIATMREAEAALAAAEPGSEPAETAPTAEATLPDAAEPAETTAAPANPQAVPGDMERNPERLTEAELFAREAEAWFAKYELNLEDPEMLDADPDGDGFTNRDEFLADTDPLDPAAHPSLITRAAMTDFHQSSLPIILESVSGNGGTFRSTKGGSSFAVTSGSAVPGTSYRLERTRSRSIVDKDGNAADVSEAVLQNTSNGAETTLVRGIPASAGDANAQIYLRGHGQTFPVRGGDRFSLPGEENITYEVLEVRSDQVVVRNTTSGSAHTIFKAAQ